MGKGRKGLVGRKTINNKETPSTRRGTWTQTQVIIILHRFMYLKMAWKVWVEGWQALIFNRKMNSGCWESRTTGSEWLEKLTGYLRDLIGRIARDVNNRMVLSGIWTQMEVRAFRVSSVLAGALHREGRRPQEPKLFMEAAGEWSHHLLGQGSLWLEGRDDIGMCVQLSKRTWTEVEEKAGQAIKIFHQIQGNSWASPLPNNLILVNFCCCDKMPWPQGRADFGLQFPWVRCL